MLGDFHAGCEHNSGSDLGEIAGGHGSQNMPFPLEGPLLFRKRRGSWKTSAPPSQTGSPRAQGPRRAVLFGLHMNISQCQRMN